MHPFSSRGNVLVGTVLILVAIMILPFVLKLIFPEIDWIYKLVLIFAIYSFVTQNMQSNGTLALLITGVLVYFMAFKYSDIFTSLWLLTFVLMVTGGTVIVTTARDFLGFGKGSHGGGHPPAH